MHKKVTRGKDYTLLCILIYLFPRLLPLLSVPGPWRGWAVRKITMLSGNSNINYAKNCCKKDCSVQKLGFITDKKVTNVDIIVLKNFEDLHTKIISSIGRGGGRMLSCFLPAKASYIVGRFYGFGRIIIGKNPRI